MHRVKFWTDERLWELLEMYENPDISTKEIANHFGTTVKTIYSIAFANEIKRGTYFSEGYIKCYRCKSVLLANSDNFYKCKSKKLGYGNVCKQCFREMRGSKRRRRMLTENEKEYIIKNYANTSYSLDDMASYLHITKKQLMNFVSRLRKKGFDIKYRVNRKEKVTNE